MSDETIRAELVLVTGGSGFIAGHCILQLLELGYAVRTTVRSLDREASVRSDLATAGGINLDRLSFVVADLTLDDGWADAMRDVGTVLHVASPVEPGHVSDENAVVGPAREGTRRVLRAARDAGVRRVVLTSAFHAVGFGHGHPDRVFTEADWSPPHGPGVDAYGRSKIFAEQGAWDFVRNEGGALELVTIVPVAVLGPVLGTAVSGTNHLIQELLTGALPGYPDLAIPIVDVRDVAAAHIAAMRVPEAAGQRFLVAGQERATPMRDICTLLRNTFGDAARKVPNRRIPSVVLKIGARFSPALKSVAPDLGYVKRVSTERARAVLGFSPRSVRDAITDCARSMIDKGLADPLEAGRK